MHGNQVMKFWYPNHCLGLICTHLNANDWITSLISTIAFLLDIIVERQCCQTKLGDPIFGLKRSISGTAGQEGWINAYIISCFFTRGGVEDTRLEAKDTKKSKAKAEDSLSKNRTSRGQGQECSRPRTEDTGGPSVLLKKRSSKIFFRRSPIHWRTPNFWLRKA